MRIDNISVGQRIKQLRMSFGFTLEEFGRKFNTSKTTVYNWEKGRNLPNKENLKTIAELGNITVDELLFGDKRLYLKNIIESELSRDIYSTWSDYIEKYKNTIIENVIHDIVNYSEFQHISFDELEKYAISGVQGYILAAIQDTDDMLTFAIGELKRIQSRIKLYIGEDHAEKNLMVDEIDIQKANSVIDFLEEVIQNISKL